MNLDERIDELVSERSLEALEALTGSRNDEILEALIQAAGELQKAETGEEADDGIVETIRQHLVECRAIGLLVDALRPAATTGAAAPQPISASATASGWTM